MLGIPLGYLLKHPAEGMELVATDPFEVWNRVQESYLAQREQRRPQCDYEHEENWEQRLHERLGVAWPAASSKAGRSRVAQVRAISVGS